MILDLQTQLKDTIEHRQVAPVQKEYQLRGSMIIKPNQTLYKLNLDTLEVDPVPLDKTVAEIKADSSVITHNRAFDDMNSLFYPAYTIKQAARHFIKVLNKAFPEHGTDHR